jgi:hypothetical protein
MPLPNKQTKFTVSIPGHTFGPLTEQQADNAAEILTTKNYTPTITPLEAFNPKTIRPSTNTKAHEITKRILLDLFPQNTYNKPVASSQVLDILYKTPGTITGSHLHIIRKELNIQSRAVRIKGISGTAYWEWVRINPDQETKNTP